MNNGLSLILIQMTWIWRHLCVKIKNYFLGSYENFSEFFLNEWGAEFCISSWIITHVWRNSAIQGLLLWSFNITNLDRLSLWEQKGFGMWKILVTSKGCGHLTVVFLLNSTYPFAFFCTLLFGLPHFWESWYLCSCILCSNYH